MPFAVSQPRQRNVEVVEFSGWRKSSKPRSSTTKAIKKDESEEKDMNMLDIKAEIGSFISSNLVGRDKHTFDKGRLQLLGAAAPKAKQQKMPFKMGRGIQQAREEREKKESRMALLGGNRVPTKRTKKVVAVKGRGRWKESVKPLDSSVGKFRGSAQVLSSRDIAKVVGRRKKR